MSSERSPRTPAASAVRLTSRATCLSVRLQYYLEQRDPDFAEKMAEVLRGERSSSGNATHPSLPREGVRTRLPCALPCRDRESAPRRRLLEQGFTAGQLGHLVFTGLPNRPNLFQVKITAAP
jgi:hypothetical protein